MIKGTTMNVTANEVIAMLPNFSEEELTLINMSLINIARAKRKNPHSAKALESAIAKATFNVGDKVEWMSRREGRVLNGTIRKIKPKYILVQTEEQANGSERYTGWNIPPLMLKKI